MPLFLLLALLGINITKRTAQLGSATGGTGGTGQGTGVNNRKGGYGVGKSKGMKGMGMDQFSSGSASVFYSGGGGGGVSVAMTDRADSRDLDEREGLSNSSGREREREMRTGAGMGMGMDIEDMDGTERERGGERGGGGGERGSGGGERGSASMNVKAMINRPPSESVQHTRTIALRTTSASGRVERTYTVGDGTGTSGILREKKLKNDQYEAMRELQMQSKQMIQTEQQLRLLCSSLGVDADHLIAGIDNNLGMA